MRYLLKKTYNKIKYGIVIRKYVRCSNCGTRIKISGSLGEKVYFNCPKCNKKDLFIITENQIKTKKKIRSPITTDDISLLSIIQTASIAAGLAYMWSYFLIFNYLYPFIRFAYALAPLIFLFLLIGLEKKQLRY